MLTTQTNIAERDANVVAKFVVNLVPGKMWSLTTNSVGWISRNNLNPPVDAELFS